MSAAVELRSGEVFAPRFVVERHLGRGAMGVGAVVDRERADVGLLALKVLLPKLVTDRDQRARFLCPLAAVLAKRGLLPVPDALTLLRQVSEALSCAHRFHVVHGEPKSENIPLVERPGRPPLSKACDIGLAKLLEAAVVASTTHHAGTPFYMELEHASEKTKIGPGTDLMAFGLVSYVLITGRAYWKSTRPFSAMNELFQPSFPSASERAAEQGLWLPPGFYSFFTRTVTRRPEQHASSAAEAFALLERECSGDLSFARAPTRVGAPRQTEARPRWRALTFRQRPVGALAGRLPPRGRSASPSGAKQAFPREAGTRRTASIRARPIQLAAGRARGSLRTRSGRSRFAVRRGERYPGALRSPAEMPAGTIEALGWRVRCSRERRRLEQSI